MSDPTTGGQPSDAASDVPTDTRSDAQPDAPTGNVPGTDVLHDTGDENVPREEQSTTASAVEERTRGWGGREATPLSDEQVSRLQEQEEPVAQGNFGAELSGDLGNAEVADETTDAPETVEPDTSLGHEGGRRYADYAGDAGPEGSA